MALFQVFLLVGFVFAVSFVIGQGIGEVSAAPSGVDPGTGATEPPVAQQGQSEGQANTATIIGIAGIATQTSGLWGEGGSSTKVPSGTGGTVTNPTGGAAAAADEGIISKLFGGTLFEGATGHLVSGLAWAGVIGGAAWAAGSFFGLDDDQSAALGLAAFGGTLAYNIASSDQILGTAFSQGTSLLIGAGVAIAIFAFLYKSKSQQIVTFQCLPWEPPLGGDRCEECNKDPLRPCSEYRCKSLGQACELLNTGTTEESCAWVNPRDVTSPIIQAWTNALKPTSVLSYTPDNAIRPPNRGVKIVDSRNSNGCLEPFTKLEFGVNTNEPSQCKISFSRNDTFDSMRYFFGESNLYRYNHTQKIKLPSPDAEVVGIGSPILENDATMELFTRCRDANGNVNEDAFVFTYCVDPSPDTTPPIIEETSIRNGGAVQFNADSVPIEVYVNEPAECKWSRQDKSYGDMENAMTCFTQANQVNADLQYTCLGNLTGIVNQQDNEFYFRCKDQPSKQESERNVNVQSYPLTLRGSQELNIIEVSPENETVSGATNTVPVTLYVKTDDGADEGLALCSFTTVENANDDEYIQMFDTGSFEHTQKLDLTAGNYNYYFRCVDAGGNSAKGQTNFIVFSDKQPPQVTRVYKDLDALKVVTNEDAQCVYSNTDCNYVFDEGQSLIYSNIERKNEHFVKWDAKGTYYIKCRDERGNEPSPNACSTVAKGVLY